MKSPYVGSASRSWPRNSTTSRIRRATTAFHPACYEGNSSAVFPPIVNLRVGSHLINNSRELFMRWLPTRRDRKSTRLNSSHLVISYAVFCLKKKKQKRDKTY